MKAGFKRGPMSAEHKAKIGAAQRGKSGYQGGGRPMNTAETLWAKVDIGEPDACWPWKGFKNAQGYGRTWISDKGYYAHRVIFDLANPGVITREAPKDRHGTGFLRHSCDNPSCCNPAHLSIGTHVENMHDKKVRGRAPKYWGENSPNAKLSNDDAAFIRSWPSLSTKWLAQALGVSKGAIDGVRYGRHFA